MPRIPNGVTGKEGELAELLLQGSHLLHINMEDRLEALFIIMGDEAPATDFNTK